MYKKFYGLKENPFNVTSDPAFFYASAHHKEAYSHLTYGIKQRKGIIVITGEIGTGKTTLCRTLLNHLDTKTKTAFILNPNFSELQLLQLIIKDFGIVTARKDRASLINVLNDFLIEETSQGNNIVVIIDEAQNLKERQLEHIRLLSNLETEKEKLLQIVLVGQPELAEKLKLHSLRQINQRVIVRYHILPLEKNEITSYIYHRLKVAGASNKLRFSEETMEEIYLYSGGTPRLINIICDHALLAGFVAEKFTLDYPLVRKCIEEIG
ncbi:MAG: AAA family ATPase [Candidatus Omnitrophota bacterium]